MAEPSILYYPSDFDAPGCYRCLFPGRQLAAHGWKVKLPPHRREGGTMQLDLDLSQRVGDIVVLQQRQERVWVEGGVSTLRGLGSVVVCDSDDDYINLPPYNPAFVGSHPHRDGDGRIYNREDRRRIGKAVKATIGSNRFNRKLMLQTMKRADFLTVATPHLAEVYESLHSDITVIRNFLDWELWDDVTPQYEVTRDRLRVGYLASFKYRGADIAVIADVVEKFMADHPEIDFVANSEEMHDALGVPVEQRITVPEYAFHEDDGTYPVGKMTAVCDIGLVPLAQNKFNEGKSHLKGMEYNAAGIPFVASNTESYRYWVRKGGGFIAHNSKEWRARLEDLLDYTTRTAFGNLGRMGAKQNSLQEKWTEWDGFYRRALGGAPEKWAREAITIGSIQKVTELAKLLRIVEERQPKVVVEIGSARGGTFWALARAAHPDALLVSIDIVAGSPMDMRNGKDVYGNRDRDLLKTYGVENQRVELIDGNSQETETLLKLMEVIGNQDIDVLFIDGDHRYEGVKSDWNLYSGLVAKGGLVLFHDIVLHEDARVGVHKLWKELKRKHRTEEILGKETWGYADWAGIGVLYA